MNEPSPNRVAHFLAINRTVGIVLVTVLLFGLGEQLWQPFLPLLLKAETRSVTDTAGELSTAALWSIGIYACLLNLFQGFCYIGGGQVTARLGDRGSLIFFGFLTIAGYVLFLTVSHPWATVLACLLILGWESLSMPVTFTTVGSTLTQERRGMAFAIQSIQKRLPKIFGPVCASGFVLGHFIREFGSDEGRLIGMHALVAAALLLGLASLAVQWRFMPHYPAAKQEGNMWAVLKQFPLALRRLLLADILTRWCDWLVRELVVVYLVIERKLSDPQIAGLIALQHVVALATYLPVGRMTQAVGLQPFIGLTFVFFALFPLTLILIPDGWIWLAFIVYGLREIGEPARKALITTSLPEVIRARGVGLYWGLRGFGICSSALVGALLWQWGGPELLFPTACGFGVLGIIIYYVFCRRIRELMRIARRIGHPRIREGVPPLAAFAAAAAVQVVLGFDARKGVLQWQALAQMHHRGFLQAAERDAHLDLALQRLIDEFLEAVEKPRRRVGKRIRLQGAQRQRWHAMQVAPKKRFRQQQHIAAWQEDRFLRASVRGYVLSRNAPVRPVNVRNRLIEDHQRLQGGSAHGVEKTPQIEEFDGFPAQAAAHVDRRDGGAFAQRVT